ncbi:MAG: lipoprotein [Burkholderiaceae bacterium]|nr:lipoprotein [Burkholderiaceae bacterium]
MSSLNRQSSHRPSHRSIRKPNRWTLLQGLATLRAIGFSACIVLAGCGQKGPLMMPTPQYPAPPASAPPASALPNP